MIDSKREINNRSLFVTMNDKSSDVNIILVHGYAEHIKRYKHFMHELDALGFNILGYDHVGHGQSDGKRAMVSSFSEYVEDLKILQSDFFQKEKKNFIFAHSMGGLVTLLYLEKYGDDRIDGVILSGAALRMYDKTPVILEKLAGVIASIFPSLPTLGVDANTVSRDPIIVEKYKNDPLNYTGKTKAKLGHEFLKAQKLAERDLAKIQVPILIMHGTEDKLIDPQSAQIIHDSISSEDKTLVMWDKLYHEIINEPEWKQVSNRIISWIEKHL